MNSSRSLLRKDSCSSVELDHMLSGEDEVRVLELFHLLS